MHFAFELQKTNEPKIKNTLIKELKMCLFPYFISFLTYAT